MTLRHLLLFSQTDSRARPAPKCRCRCSKGVKVRLALGLAGVEEAAAGDPGDEGHILFVGVVDHVGPLHGASDGGRLLALDL